MSDFRTLPRRIADFGGVWYHGVEVLGVCRYGPGKAAFGFVCVKRARARKLGVCRYVVAPKPCTLHTIPPKKQRSCGVFVWSLSCGSPVIIYIVYD